MSTFYNITNSTIQQYFALEGCWVQGTYSSQVGLANVMQTNFQRSRDGVVRFRATISQIDLVCIPNGTPVRLVVDRVDVVGSTFLPNTATWGTQTAVFTGLDDTAEHEYMICSGGNATFFYLQQIGVVGTVNTATLARARCSPLTATQSRWAKRPTAAIARSDIATRSAG